MYAMRTSDGAVLMAGSVEELGYAIAQLETTKGPAVTFYETDVVLSELMERDGGELDANQIERITLAMNDERRRLAELGVG
jgi:hypothetical protein